MKKKREGYVRVRVREGEEDHFIVMAEDDDQRYAKAGEVVEIPERFAVNYESADTGKVKEAPKFDDLTLAQLRQLAKENDLDAGGSKEELIERLQKMDVQAKK